jgi:HEAT repeat protein
VEPLLTSPQVHERAAAVRVLAGVEEQAALAALLGALSDPSSEVRAVAREELVASTGRTTAGELERAMDEAQDPQRRAECLRVIVAREDSSASARLQAAVSDSSPVVRLTALELAGAGVDPALEPAVLRAAGSIDAEERAVGRRGLLAYADAHRLAGEDERALELYHALLADGDPDAATRAALVGVALVGDPASLEHVRPLVGRAGLRDEVDRARVTLAARLGASDRAAAVAELETICTEAPSRSVRAEAAAALRELGVDTSAYAARRGFLTTWYLSGPVEGCEIGVHPFGVEGPAFPAGAPEQASAGPGMPPWTRVEVIDLDGLLDLAALLDPDTNVCAYALWEIRADAAVDAQLRIGSDDGVAVWLNNEPVHLNDTSRGVTVDEDQVDVRLREGANLLLVQVTQGGGGWGLCVRLCTAEGEPVDLSR